MTTWVNSQFPRPDFHRQVQRHYGLQYRIRPREAALELSNTSMIPADAEVRDRKSGFESTPKPLPGSYRACRRNPNPTDVTASLWIGIELDVTGLPARFQRWCSVATTLDVASSGPKKDQLAPD